MNLAGLKKFTKDVEIQGQAFTLKKWPLGFSEYMTLKAAEGKDLEYLTIGKSRILKKVNSYGDYSLDLMAGQLFHGLAGWGLVDGEYHLDLTEAACRNLVQEYPDLAGEVLREIFAFNEGPAEEVKKN